MTHDAILAAHIAARTLDYHLCIAQGMALYGHTRDAQTAMTVANADLRNLAEAMGFDLVPRLDAVKAAREVA